MNDEDTSSDLEIYSNEEYTADDIIDSIWNDTISEGNIFSEGNITLGIENGEFQFFIGTRRYGISNNIKNLIDNGCSILLSIQYGLLTIDNLYQFIEQDLTVGYYSMIVYRILCKLDQDLLRDGEHFLATVYHPKYASIYMRSKDIFKLSEIIKDPNLERKVLAGIEYILENPTNITLLNVMCNKVQMDLKDLSPKLIKTALLCDSDKYTSNANIETMVKYDNLSSLGSLDINERHIFFEKFLDKVATLKNQEGDIYKKYIKDVMKPYYLQYILKTVNISKPFCRREQFRLLVLLYENVFNTDMLKYPLEYYNIHLLPTLHRIYLLGYDLFGKMPTEEQITESMDKLKQLGYKKYLKLVYAKNREKIVSYTPENMKEGKEYQYILQNDKDLILNKLHEYNISECVMTTSENNNLFVFTRNSFPHLLETKTNPYTKQPLDEKILHTLWMKNMFFSGKKKFLSIRPLKEHYEDLSKDVMV